MIVDLRELRLKDEPLEVEKRFSDAELKVDSHLLHLEGPMYSHLFVSLHGDCARVRGHLEGSVRVTCCRCAQAILNRLKRTSR